MEVVREPGPQDMGAVRVGDCEASPCRLLAVSAALSDLLWISTE